MVVGMSTVTKKTQKKASYLREVQQELKKVSWTSRAELLFATKTVIFAIFVFGFATYLVDLALRGVLDVAGMITKGIFG